MQFTQEQQAAIDLAAKGESFSLVAPAGSGKSATAVGMGGVLQGKKVLYLVYNKAAKVEAEAKFKQAKMPWVDVRTTSSIAWRAFADKRALGAEVAEKYAARMDPKAQAVPAREVAKRLKLKDEDFGDGLILDGYTQAKLVYDTIERFCNSNRPKISERDVPLVVVGAESTALSAARKHIAKLAQMVWLRSIEPDSKLRFSMNYAFKLVASDPNKDYGYDAVLVDEAQDSNDATMQFLKHQKGAQTVLIGDPAQALYCQVPGTQVEVVDRIPGGPTPTVTKPVAIEDLKVGDRVVTYNNGRLWRNGREITHISRFRHEGDMVRVVTRSGLTSSYTPKHHCIVRFDDNLADKHVVYLMRRGDQYRIGRSRIAYDSAQGVGPIRRCRREKADGVWFLSMHDSAKDASLAEMLVQHEFNVPGVHFEPTSNDAADIVEFWRRLGSNAANGEACLAKFGLLAEHPLWKPGTKERIGLRLPFPTAAANVMDGMQMLPLRNVDQGENGSPRHIWEEVTVEKYYYAGDVVSLEVDEHHNYFGDGILTHNSWRGATDQILRFDGPRLHLTQSFRFGPAIAEEAMKHLPFTETGVTIKGLPTIKDKVTEGEMPNPDVVLCRTNSGAMEWVMSYLSIGKRVALVRGKDQIESLAYAAASLMKGERPGNLELSHFTTWGELVEFADEPGGGQYKPLVRMVQAYGVGRLIDACKKITNYSTRYPQHDVAISTCHSIKGLEWQRVQIGDDFREPAPVENPETGVKESGVIDKHEAMIHYVAVTRAQEHLDRSGLTWIDKYPAKELVKA